MNVNTMQQKTRERARRIGWVLLMTGLLVASLVMGGCGALMVMFHGEPMGFEAGPKPEAASEFGFAQRVSRAGLYRVGADPLQPIVIGRMHAMRLTVHTLDGHPVEGADLAVDGGMPEHGHGLPTQPQVTADLGNGAYELEGMKYNMGGWWVVRVRIVGPAGSDEILFNLNL